MHQLTTLLASNEEKTPKSRKITTEKNCLKRNIGKCEIFR